MRISDRSSDVCSSDLYRAALAKVNAHDRMKSFETIRAICDRALEWGPEYEDEARLALAYALDGVLDVDQTQIEELEDECRVNHEFGWAYCERKKAFEDRKSTRLNSSN